MVHKYSVKRKGKTFGPYYYESYREGNKVKKKYLGDKKQYDEWIKKSQERQIKRKEHIYKTININVSNNQFKQVKSLPSKNLSLINYNEENHGIHVNFLF